MKNQKPEIRMTNQIRMTEIRSGFHLVIWVSGLIRHSDFGFRIFARFSEVVL